MKTTASLYGIVGAAIINLPHVSVPVWYLVLVVVLVLSIHLFELTVLDPKSFHSHRQKAVVKLLGYGVCFLMLNTIYHYPFPSSLAHIVEIVVLGGFLSVWVYMAALKSEKQKGLPPPF